MAHERNGSLSPVTTTATPRKTLILDGKRVDGRPAAQGLYNPAHEHDACGIGMIANIKNKPSHEVVQKGLEILENLEHRGAVGADPLMGDGAGILVQTPHAFFKAVPIRSARKAPLRRGHAFYPNTPGLRDRCAEPCGAACPGRPHPSGRTHCPHRQFQALPRRHRHPADHRADDHRPPDGLTLDEFERKLLIVRKVISNTVYGEIPEAQSDNGFYVVSMSARTIVYKGMFLAEQLGAFYPDLHDEQFESAIALVHQRFSTNTFPSWKLAHPYRMTTHNGEINTIGATSTGWRPPGFGLLAQVWRRHHQDLADLL
jgi:glutamate synthase (NADPH/NADH) large chain